MFYQEVESHFNKLIALMSSKGKISLGGRNSGINHLGKLIRRFEKQKLRWQSLTQRNNIQNELNLSSEQLSLAFNLCLECNHLCSEYISRQIFVKEFRDLAIATNSIVDKMNSFIIPQLQEKDESYRIKDLQIFHGAFGYGRHSGYFPNLFREIKMSKSHIIIQGWDLVIGHNFGMTGEQDLKSLLTKKAVEGVQISISVWDNGFQSIKVIKKWIKNLRKTKPEAASNIAVRFMSHLRFPIVKLWALHCKMAIIDDMIFTGGIDITEQRGVTWNHASYDKKWGSWHDVHCLVKGIPFVINAIFYIQYIILNTKTEWESQPLFLHIKKISEKQLKLFNILFSESRESANLKSLPSPASVIKFIQNSPELGTIKDSYVKVILNAKNFIYIENQYFNTKIDSTKIKTRRCFENPVFQALAERLIRAHRRQEDFICIVVVPYTYGPSCAQGDFMAIGQWQTTCALIDHVKYRCGIPDTERFDRLKIVQLASNDFRSGALGLYVHSKIIMVDDNKGIISSANLCDRSLLPGRDYEGGFLFSANESDSYLKKKLFDFRYIQLKRFAPGLSETFYNFPHLSRSRSELSKYLNNNLVKMRSNQQHDCIKVIDFEAYLDDLFFSFLEDIKLAFLNTYATSNNHPFLSDLDQISTIFSNNSICAGKFKIDFMKQLTARIKKTGKRKLNYSSLFKYISRTDAYAMVRYKVLDFQNILDTIREKFVAGKVVQGKSTAWLVPFGNMTEAEFHYPFYRRRPAHVVDRLDYKLTKLIGGEAAIGSE
ncbi:hypothetical protein P0136_12440 [Lentisphaerota bacterium ZTH]|nr:hypothetical protein JYG24_10045 [Lentisphaerota bacterium]WET06166.1 hypothetical protein P0136_12440 [Lentisphaerota bacterium ZTH]